MSTTAPPGSARKRSGLRRIPMPTRRADFRGARLCVAVIGALLLSALAWFPSVPLVARAATTGWSIVSSPNVGTEGDRLLAESCTSTTFCMAGGFSSSAGTAAATLAEKWSGTTWVSVTSANASSDNELLGVSCVSTTFCMAVGDEFHRGIRSEPGRAVERHVVEHRHHAGQGRQHDGEPAECGQLREQHVLRRSRFL